MKTTVFYSIVLGASLILSSNANAVSCGTGYIVDIKEGGWNSDDFMIKLEGPNAGASTLWNGFIRFTTDNLSETRINAIRRLATTAFALDAMVWTNSHHGDCTSATEFSIIR